MIDLDTLCQDHVEGRALPRCVPIGGRHELADGLREAVARTALDLFPEYSQSPFTWSEYCRRAQIARFGTTFKMYEIPTHHQMRVWRLISRDLHKDRWKCRT